METIKSNYQVKCATYSDIYEHLPTLNDYASKCETIVECGMRSVVSSYAFANGLLNNGSKNKQLISVDLDYSTNIDPLKDACKKADINFIFMMANDVKINLEPMDLLFIDTFHVKAHLQVELKLHADKAKKYIILHDTTVDRLDGECVRNGWSAEKISLETGYSIEDINTGLWPAVEEFLEKHPEWVIEKEYTNNNGLTILARK